MLRIRAFRNDDPPGLVALWNQSVTGRGSYALHGAGPLERHIFSRPYFDPAGFLIAEDDGRMVGFVHAGFGPRQDESAQDRTGGVICAIAVLPSHRRRRIGSELLLKAEQFLAERGTKVVQAGPARPRNPFYFGLYGGSDSPGFLLSDAAAGPFFESHGYRGVATNFVLQRWLDRPVVVPDPRFAAVRRKYEMIDLSLTAVGSWWQECVLGLIEPTEFRLVEKLTGLPAARALAWSMDGYNDRWNAPAAGILDLQVRQDLRRQGLAKFLVMQLLRNLKERFIGIVEVHIPEANQAALGLFRALGMEQVDIGRVYRRELPRQDEVSSAVPGQGDSRDGARNPKTE
jgi:ribosomal protein S18 acetylase RimI-like enzyme